MQPWFQPQCGLVRFNAVFNLLILQSMPQLRSIVAAPLLALAALLTAPALRAQEEVPFITTPDNVTLEMLRVANVGPADHVIDLGSGDGRIVILAARRFGASGLGVEIVPDLVQRSIQSARDAGVADRVAFKVQDLFETDLSRATVVTMYLLTEVNLKLRPTLLALKAGTRVVSLPSFSRFEHQPVEYQDAVLPPSCLRRVSIEAGVTLGWQKWVGLRGRAIGIDRFGESAPGNIVLERLGMTKDAVIATVRSL